MTFLSHRSLRLTRINSFSFSVAGNMIKKKTLFLNDSLSGIISIWLHNSLVEENKSLEKFDVPLNVYVLNTVTWPI